MFRTYVRTVCTNMHDIHMYLVMCDNKLCSHFTRPRARFMIMTVPHCFNCYFVDMGIFFSSGPEGEFEPDPDRNFQDPAFTNFQESAQVRFTHPLIHSYCSLMTDPVHFGSGSGSQIRFGTA
jgi:hypothetical protein